MNQALRADAQRCPTRRRQSGAVLVVALLFLMIITMLGVSSLQSTTAEERMSGNVRDTGNALQAAEAALRDAWYDINGVCAPGATACALRTPPISGATNFGNSTGTIGSCSATGLCLPNTGAVPIGSPPKYLQFDIANWSSSGANAVYPVDFGNYTLGNGDKKFPITAGSEFLIKLATQQPQYIIEALCTPDSLSSLGGAGCPKYHYRVTARGFGGNSNTQVTLQMVVRL